MRTLMRTTVKKLIPDVQWLQCNLPWWFPHMLEVQTSAMRRIFKYAVCAYGSVCSYIIIFLAYCYHYSNLTPIALLEDNQYSIQYSKNNTDHDNIQNTWTSSIIRSASEYNREIHRLPRYPLRRTLLISSRLLRHSEGDLLLDRLQYCSRCYTQAYSI